MFSSTGLLDYMLYNATYRAPLFMIRLSDHAEHTDDDQDPAVFSDATAELNRI